MIKRFSLILMAGLIVIPAFSQTSEFVKIARLKYQGGDWYSNRTSLPNLMLELKRRIGIYTTDNLNTPPEEAIVTPSDTDIFRYPLVYMNGHGKVKFSDEDVKQLRKYLHRGGTLWADDNFGMDEYFRPEIAKVLPNHPLVEIPNDHPIYSIYYKFDNGLPKIHEHHGGAPHLYGIYLDDRLAVIYTFNTDIGDGLESEGVHPEDSAETREQAMRMAINIVLMVLSG